MLDRTLKMFEYEGLPDSIPAKELEQILQTKGYAYITEVNGDLYALWGGLGGEQDAYYKPTTITISNPWLNFTKSLDIEKDGVMMDNDDMKMGLTPLYDKYNTLLVENDITMVLNSYNNRIQTLISAGDDATQESAEEYLKKVRDGEMGIIAEQRIFEGVSVHNSASNIAANTMALTEFHQYLRATLLNEVGLDANFNMKRERLTAGEVSQNDEGLYPLITNMLYSRRKAISLINEKYGTNITVGFGSAWKNRNLDGELSQQMALEHTDDMAEGQLDLETLTQLEAALGVHFAQPQPDEAPEPEQVEEEAAPQNYGLAEETLNTDLSELPDDQRLEIYDLLFSEEEGSIERIKEILEGAEEADEDEEQAKEEEPVDEDEDKEEDA
jgi:hypothetical protein